MRPILEEDNDANPNHEEDFDQGQDEEYMIISDPNQAEGAGMKPTKRGLLHLETSTFGG